VESPLIAAIAAWIERRFPTARWETREPGQLRAFLPIADFDLGAFDCGDSVRVCTVLEDCRRDEDDWLDGSVREWERYRDRSPAVRDRIGVDVDGRVICASFYLDDDTTDLTEWLDAYVDWLAGFAAHAVAPATPSS
jgi:hypothetical protein